MALTKPKLSTNINTDSSVFADPILVLHQGSSVADVDVGFLMNRSNGLTSNAAVIWQESSKSFVSKSSASTEGLESLVPLVNKLQNALNQIKAKQTKHNMQIKQDD